MNWLSSFKKVTHSIAVAGGLAIGWAFTQQGQDVIGGLIKAYPKLSAVTGVLAFLATIYHSPKA